MCEDTSYFVQHYILLQIQWHRIATGFLVIAFSVFVSIVLLWCAGENKRVVEAGVKPEAEGWSSDG